MSHARVRKLFSAALATYAAREGIKITYDNVNDTTGNDDSIKTHIIPADTFSDTLSGDHIGYLGIYQMTITITYGVGYLKTEKIIDDLQREVFNINKTFTDDTGFTVQVITPIHAPEGKQEGTQWVVPAYFNYRADTN